MSTFASRVRHGIENRDTGTRGHRRKREGELSERVIGERGGGASEEDESQREAIGDGEERERVVRGRVSRYSIGQKSIQGRPG